jgi:hypothetical protein
MFKEDVEHVMPKENVGHELELVVRLSELRVLVQFPEKKISYTFVTESMKSCKYRRTPGKDLSIVPLILSVFISYTLSAT